MLFVLLFEKTRNILPVLRSISFIPNQKDKRGEITPKKHISFQSLFRHCKFCNKEEPDYVLTLNGECNTETSYIDFGS